MSTSATINYASTEIRRSRRIERDGETRTVRVRPGRTNARRAAIRASWGW
ncbi:hypothetical protein [Polymorphospora lycopeni]|uniref:Uncharacterized protein n=1 Tax=Polymorphospora lycopeni TaxID=3140240 RepID=A0ABV5CL09_9ACTN